MSTASSEPENIGQYFQSILDGIEVQDDEEYHKEQIFNLYKKMIPRRFWHPTPEFLMQKRESFYLWGAVGVGKTHACYTLVKEAIHKKITGIHRDLPEVVNWPTYCEEYKIAPFHEKEEYIKKASRGLKIFDDIGSEFINDQTLGLLYMVLNNRLEYGLATGFTSNMALGKLPYNDKRIISRLQGIVKDNKKEMTGEDWRLKEQEHWMPPIAQDKYQPGGSDINDIIV